MTAKPSRLTLATPGSLQQPIWDDRERAVEVHRNADGSVWAYSYSANGEHWLRLPGIASFRFGSSEGEAVALAEPGASPDLIEDAYQRAVLPMALHANGHEVMHASAVVISNRVVALCGPSKTGKSTTAYGLHRRGHRVWADDALVFEAVADRVLAVPYPHRLRIRAQAAEFFGLNELRRTDDSSWDEPEQAQADPARLAAIFVLERGESLMSSVRAVRLSPSEAFAALIANAYWFRLHERARKRLTMERYLTVSLEVPVFRIVFEATLDQLPAMLDCIEFSVESGLHDWPPGAPRAG